MEINFGGSTVWIKNSENWLTRLFTHPSLKVIINDSGIILPIIVFGGALLIKWRNLESSINLSDILIREIEYFSSDAKAFIRDVFPLPGEPKNK